MKPHSLLPVVLVFATACAQVVPQAPAQIEGTATRPRLKAAPVPGWPRLRVETRYVARIAMRGYCLKVPAGTPIPEASLDSCARPDFWRGVCDVYIDVQYRVNPSLREHEEKRCRGYDHQGSDSFAEALQVWRERGENRYADMVDFEWMMFVIEPPGNCKEGDRSCVEVRR
ncbi:MAG: hypothetical protein ACRET6_13690 [Burkholderiales bacterium]